MAEYGILSISAITQLHTGAGEGLGLIDRPIMRERTTRYPLIQGSSIKGVLRHESRHKYGSSNPDVSLALYGPEPKRGQSENDFAGAIGFGDGKLLAFPIRSLCGGFVWATSLLALFRFARVLEIAGIKGDFPNLTKLLDSPPATFSEVIICPSGKDIISADNNVIILEEFPKVMIQSSLLEETAKELANSIYGAANSFLCGEFRKRFVILPESSFSYFVVNATQISPNIRIGERGTTDTGSLRYTEYLPEETLLFGLLSFEPARHPNAKNMNLDVAKSVKAKFQESIPNGTMLQIGSNETTGKGLVNLNLLY